MRVKKEKITSSERLSIIKKFKISKIIFLSFATISSPDLSKIFLRFTKALFVSI